MENRDEPALSGLYSLSSESPWDPSADVYQKEDSWLIKVELPGVKKEDISVSLRLNELEISGCRKDSLAHTGLRQVSMEILYSRFHKTVTLPRKLEAYRVNSQLEDGILYVDVQPAKAA